MEKTESPKPQPAPAVPRYRTTFLFVAIMLAGIVIGWIAMLALTIGRY